MKIKETLRKKAKGKKGFTLVELVIVIAVLAIIAAIAIPTVTNVINNANTAADASNAQSIELAIKTAQAECEANATNQSTRANNVITGSSKTLAVLLSQYGVSTDVITTPRVSNDKFFYNPTTGKVVANTAASMSGYAQITGTTEYAVNPSTAGSGQSADITLTVTAAS